MRKCYLLFACISYSLSLSAQRPGAVIDVVHYQFTIGLNDASDTIQGDAVISLKLLKETSVIMLDLASVNKTGKGMSVSVVEENGHPLSFTHTKDLLTISFIEKGKKDEAKKIHIVYHGIPADGLIISTTKFKHRSFFADNWPNRAHNWLPCVDHPADKAAVDFIVTAPDYYQVISNGIKTEENNLPGHLTQTHYRETTDLPTKEMAIGVCAFAVNYAGDVDCIPIYSWVYPEEKDKGFYDYALAVDILPFFVKNIGPYAYRKLANVESKTRFGGEENASAIFYSEHSIAGDRKVEALLTHEIAHQWFGNAATEKDWPHIWLSEGFATYMTHLYLENKYGADTLLKRMIEDRKAVIAFSKKRNTPVIDTTVTEDFMQLLNENSYQKGGWVLHMLRRKLGDETFWKGIRKYYTDFAGHNADTEDFRQSMESVSGVDLKLFFQQWLYTPRQPDLVIDWKYEPAKKQVEVTITQTQKIPFTFSLDIMLLTGADPINQSVLIAQEKTIIAIPCSLPPTEFIADPGVNLLFQSVIKAVK